MEKYLLPNEDHVARFCRVRAVSNGRAMPEAFLLRIGRGETELSVNWIECLRVDESKRNITGCEKRIKQYLNSGYIAMLNVGEIREIKCNTKNLDVVDTGNCNNLCHCSIIGLHMEEDYLVQEELAELANKYLLRKI